MSTQPFLKGLSAEFRGFYRLFRRTCSASVLQRSPEAVALRNMYRTTFRRAGLVFTRIKDQPANSDANLKRKEWFSVWNQRMDNTLSLLYNSSHTRGLPHQITKFMGHFVHKERLRHWEGKDRGLHWNPHLPKDAPQYKPRVEKVSQAQAKLKERRMKDFGERVLGPLREVVKMAEGRDEISFGNLKKYTRVQRRRKPIPKSLRLRR